MLIPIFNAAKSIWSRVNDWIKRGERRARIPKFRSPTEVAAYIQKYGAYTGDPIGGAADFFIHPERLQSAMEDGTTARIAIDCDDWASWAYAALRRINGCVPTLYTLEDSSGQWGHHVVCAYVWHGDTFGVIDTNGHRRLMAGTVAELCNTFTGIYSGRGYTYSTAVPTPYPFD